MGTRVSKRFECVVKLSLFTAHCFVLGRVFPAHQPDLHNS